MDLYSMPTEVLGSIFSNLTLIDANSVNEACENSKELRNPVNAEVNRRKLVHNYISENLMNGTVLLDILADTNVWLSGSRAAEFFIPGVCSQDSDWDFFYSEKNDKAYDFIKRMEQQGVIWEDPTTTIHRRIDETGAYFIYPEYVDGLTDTIQQYRVFKDKSDEVSAKLRNLPRPIHHFVSIRKNEERIDVSKELDESDTDPYSVSVLSGSLISNGKKHKIQFIHCENRYTLAKILNFHSTQIQAFITGFSAIHLHSKLSQNMMAIQTQPTFNNPRVIKAIEKYKARGFKYVKPTDISGDFPVSGLGYGLDHIYYDDDSEEDIQMSDVEYSFRDPDVEIIQYPSLKYGPESSMFRFKQLMYLKWKMLDIGRFHISVHPFDRGESWQANVLAAQNIMKQSAIEFDKEDALKYCLWS